MHLKVQSALYVETFLNLGHLMTLGFLIQDALYCGNSGIQSTMTKYHIFQTISHYFFPTL